MDGYWSHFSQRRLARRRALALIGGAVAGALLLEACGDGGDSSSSKGSKGSKDKSGLLSSPVDATRQAVPGGSWVTAVDMEAINVDPIAQTTSTGFNFTMMVYSKLAKYGLSKKPNVLPTTREITGDAAESWEITPDATQITLKLRQDHKFDPRPPTNGRAMTTDDVKWSWERFSSLSAFRGDLLNSLSEAGIVSSVSFPDARTIVIKLAYSYGQLLDIVAYYPYFNIMPVEAEKGFDPRKDMRGSGPFRLTEYTPSLQYVYEKNKDWYVKDRPFLDSMKKLIIPDYAAGLAQFQAKALDTFAVRQENVLQVKQARPELVMLQNPNEVGAPQFAYWTFSARSNSAFRDARIRRAVSMLIDRDLFIDTVYDLKPFRDAGLPTEALWNTHDYAGNQNWVNPKTSAKELGEGGKYFQLDPAEAKKMLSAAGKSPVKEVIHTRATRAQSQPTDILVQMLQEGGLFDMKINVMDEPTYRNYQASKGNGYDGMYIQTNGGHNEEAWFTNLFSPFGKYSVDGEKPIPGITDKVIKMRKEVDDNKRNAQIKELQKDLALDMTCLVLPGYSIGFTLHWPWLKNYDVFTVGDLDPSWSSSRVYTEYWYDKAAKT